MTLPRVLHPMPIAMLLGVLLAAACGSDSEEAAGGGKGYTTDGGAGTSGKAGQGQGGSIVNTDGGDAAGAAGNGTAGSAGDASCGAQGLAIEAIPPDMLVVFDRSCSMRRFYNSSEPVFGTGPADPNTRWAMAHGALEAVMATYENLIRFGLMVFPRPYFGCGDNPEVNVMPDIVNKAAVLASLDQNHPFDVCLTDAQPKETPTGAALTSVLNASIFKPTERDAYVLLMTDGMASCGETATSLGQLVQGIAAKGAKTGVVGFGDVDAAQSVQMLDAMGQAGGLKAGGPPWYWLAQNPAELQAAIGAIVSKVISCKFKLQDVPPDPGKVFAYFDGQPVPADPANGWTYDAATNTVTFHGTACKSLQEGKVKNVSLVFGCPDPTCVPTTEKCDGYDNDCNGLVDENCVK